MELPQWWQAEDAARPLLTWTQACRQRQQRWSASASALGSGGGALESSFLAVAAFLRFAMIDSIILCSIRWFTSTTLMVKKTLYIVNKNKNCNSDPMGCFITVFVLAYLWLSLSPPLSLLHGWGDWVPDDVEEE